MTTDLILPNHILFADDWRHFPGAIMDLETSNKSFVRMVEMYADMGIRNHAFPLALLQPELQGVDPFDPKLTPDIMLKIGTECRYNPWYFFREIFRLPPQGGDESQPLIANRGNIAAYWSFLNHLDCALIQPRQTGKSVSSDGLMTWIKYFGSTNSTITLLTKDDTLRRKNVERLKNMRKLLPQYLIHLRPDDADNQNEITYKALSNHYTTQVAQNAEANALNVGRGLTTPILQCDEGPFINFIRVALPAALAAATASRNEAARYGRPYGNIFTTTAGKRDSPDGKFMYDLITSGAVWNERFFDAEGPEQLKELILQSCKTIYDSNGRPRPKRRLVNLTLSHRQLGYTDEWLMEAIANAGGTEEEINRDFFNQWTAGGLSSPLTVDLNEAIAASDMEPVSLEITNENYIVNWYLDEEQVQAYKYDGRKIIVGLDTSDAVGRDGIAMQGIDTETLETVFAANINDTNLVRFSQFLFNFMMRNEQTVLVPERKSSAPGIIDYLIIKFNQAGVDPFKRIFNRVVDEADDHPDDYVALTRPMAQRDEYFYDSRKSKFGFNTSGTNRPLLYGSVLQNAAKRSGHSVRDKTLSIQLRSLVVKNGRIDHTKSGNDDNVVAWLLAHWFLSYGRHLEHYGIDTRRLMQGAIEVGQVIDPEAVARRKEIESMNDQIDEIIDAMKSTRDNIIRMKYEVRLRALYQNLPQEAQDTRPSLDALLSQTREEDDTYFSRRFHYRHS